MEAGFVAGSRDFDRPRVNSIGLPGVLFQSAVG
jgi:hypothetical protein